MTSSARRAAAYSATPHQPADSLPYSQTTPDLDDSLAGPPDIGGNTPGAREKAAKKKARAVGTADAQILHDVRVEQMEAVFRSAALATFATGLCAFLLSWHLDNIMGTAGHFRGLFWLIIKYAIAITRIGHTLMFRQQKGQASLTWLHWSNGLLALDGITWGLAPFILTPLSDTAAITLMATICGVATIAVFVAHTEWWACVSFVVPTFVPLQIYLLMLGTTFGYDAALSVTIFAAILLAMARQAEQHVVELMTLRFTNKRLTDHLESALAKKTREGQSKDLFVANMSHELRTPLHGILGLTQRLYATSPMADRAVLKLIRGSGEHLLLLINNVLEYSRFEAHGIDLLPSQVDLGRTISEAVAMCAPSAAEKSIQLSENLDLGSDGAPITFIDPFRIRQVVLNLVGNAIKFTPANGRVTVTALWPKGGRFVLRIADTGIGMTPQAIAALFAPFAQVDVSRTRRHGGTGLGLNITRSICHKLGGEVTCTSEVDKGTVFEVWLPLTRTDPEAANSKTQDSVHTDFFDADGSADLPPEVAAGLAISIAKGSTDFPKRLGRVLLAEDNPVNALVAEFSLKRFGIECETVTDGAEAVNRLSQAGHGFSLVLMDCQMPVMDGFSATRAIREFERNKSLEPVPIVALTANVFQADREECRDAGMNAFLPKPFNDDQLRHVLALFSMLAPPKDEPADKASASDLACLLL